MSHFSTILENLRMVAIKRSPLTQQKQKQQQQQQQQQQQAVTPTSPQQQHQCPLTAEEKSCNNEQEVKINNDNKQIKVFISKQPPTPQSPEAPSSPLTTTTTSSSSAAQCTKSSCHNHDDQHSEKTNNSGNAAGSSTPDKKAHHSSHGHGHKRQSISARGSIGSAEHSSAKNSPGRERNRGSGSSNNVIVEIDGAKNSSSSSSRGARELSPTPKNQQRKMSTDFRSRAGSFIHVDEEGRSILMRKPVRLKNIEGRPEVYDTLHFKGREVRFFFFCHS